MAEQLWIPLNVSMERSPLFPNPFTCISEMVYTAASEFKGRSPAWGKWGEWLNESWHWLELTVNFDPSMIIFATIICIALTIIRSVLSRVVFTPFAQSYKLNKEGIQKFPESIWKFMVYLVTWIWSAYITHDKDIMFDLLSHWTTWYPGVPADRSIYWLFTFEVGFYIHYSYGMLFLEARRKDFTIMLLHHVLTIALILGCYTIRFQSVGVLLIFIHDIGDVFLEGSKSLNYFKEQNGKLVKSMDLCANVGFLLFAIEYFLFRIYWFVTKALYSTLHVCILVFPAGPFYLPFNIMSLALFGMQIFWFGLIIRLLVKVLIQREDLTDIRDIKEEEEGQWVESNGQGMLTKKENGSISATSENKKKQQ